MSEIVFPKTEVQSWKEYCEEGMRKCPICNRMVPKEDMMGNGACCICNGDCPEPTVEEIYGMEVLGMG